ncbi:hypothetical protein RFN28_16590 [Mesorhizobium sp. VK24D]|uniref:Uncharacterized protein n=1 Tax=Mesorhizobium album TaxID=3072314 RepID=A0ABU4XZG7_9HYPH|nr:hypothetical protein [Mesorhizobium sp. VK24D]
MFTVDPKWRESDFDLVIAPQWRSDMPPIGKTGAASADLFLTTSSWSGS